MNLKILCTLACYLIPTAYAAAAPVSAGQASQLHFTAEGESSQRRLQDKAANAWGISTQEYERYQDVMQGPRGVYSPGLDPLTALGIEARSDEERRRYAELQVKTERQRVEKELSYQRAYDEAYRRLYPSEKAIEISSATPTNPTANSSPLLQGDGRLAIFVKDNCVVCIDEVKKLQASQTPFDLYFVGSQGDDERIRRWAILAGVDPVNVKSRRITLNHDQGRWLGLGLGGELPAAVKQVNGQWRRQ
ncbi:TIGR03759 family integrating conjugative element protein [Pseudomonas sp. MPFS]|uniref:TIGR03759 family integrating conjugative element protein n=1 Tax=Pseudomonas sp. MPFS TaxID=2795724 RepID=UPI001F13395F|nr:TIGR03759 family integrating conjugative element protein [Pseudomonas sp. MPFS]UMZ10670.1 TIGR03759 family integrating conjugative element protein [Pseudomonas sp. MPFS]